MRVRLRFTKVGKVRWTSHRDLARMLERAFRRTQLPLAYSGGFSPRPKVSFGLALPTGAESVAEYLDLELAEGATVDLDDAAGPAVRGPAGRRRRAWRRPRSTTGRRRCRRRSRRARGVVEVSGAEHDELCEKVAAVIAAPSLVVTRKRKGKLSPTTSGPASSRCVSSRASRSSASWPPSRARCGRPSWCGRSTPASRRHRVRRTNQWIERDGARGVSPRRDGRAAREPCGSACT